MPKSSACLLPGLIAVIALLAPSSAGADDPRAGLDYFEREVRPILVDACQKCHGPRKQESDLRLDSRAAVLKGGASGAAVIPGQPDKSPLIEAIRYAGDVQMPPQAKLTETQIAAITHWVKLGAPWPDEPVTAATAPSAAQNHWAFQPLRDPPVPAVEGDISPNPIDAFIRARLSAAGLTPSPRADRRTLIRRATYSLTGLPPTPEEVEAFEHDPNPRAYEQLVERLLAQPQYGEHWGRHWLDVARYSDTKGYVYAREQRMWVHAWVYRDWVVQALNDDLRYDRFLLLQIAADQVAPEDKASLAGMGFLTLGRRFLGVSREIIDDRIDVVTRGTMGLTVACARCHDHKYDPIPTSDYYSLYGIFQSCAEQLTPIAEPAVKDAAYQKYAVELANRREKLTNGLSARRLETANRNRSRAADYLAAQLELHKYPAEGFDQILATTDLLPTFVRRWQAYLDDAEKSHDPVFVPWHAFAEIPAREFRTRSAAVTKDVASRSGSEVNRLVAAKFRSAPQSMAEVAARYGELLVAVQRQWQAELQAAADEQRPPPARLADNAAEALRQVLYHPNGPCEVPDEPIVNIEYYFDSGSCDALWKLQNDLDNWILQAPPSTRHAVVLKDREWPTMPHIFKRGNPALPGDEVPRQFVSVVAGPERQPFATGSGRLELARAIVDPQNPLTPRVIVNRVWAYHFGAGLVRTPSDFGTRADPPSHPELLDWLTSRFIEDGWSLKQLHRRIVLSQTYQQASGSERLHSPGPRPRAPSPAAVDPDNRLLGWMNNRRLSFEEMRDSLLAATGQLDRTIGGRAGDLFSPKFARRTLYGSIDRQFLPSTLRVFDFANPDLHIPQRSDTTVPQQALFFLNHPLMIGYAESLSARTASAATAEQRVQQMFRLAYQRPATSDQVQAALALVASAAPEDASAELQAATRAWQYGYGSFDEKRQRVTRFEKLPYFIGSAWQGSAAYPDGQLGWVQLTAAGGHPGNDLAHAAIRRWTAPRDMQVRVQSTLIHEPKQGAGVRGFLVSSRGGLLAQATVHHRQAELSLATLDVRAGDTLDFVADIGNKLSSNQFLWKAILTPADDPAAVFDSERDFAGQSVKHLGPWEQLAQVLLAANEFVFVD